jgi:hypothetical protein
MSVCHEVKGPAVRLVRRYLHVQLMSYIFHATVLYTWMLIPTLCTIFVCIVFAATCFGYEFFATFRELQACLTYTGYVAFSYM